MKNIIFFENENDIKSFVKKNIKFTEEEINYKYQVPSVCVILESDFQTYEKIKKINVCNKIFFYYGKLYIIGTKENIISLFKQIKSFFKNKEIIDLTKELIREKKEAFILRSSYKSLVINKKTILMGVLNVTPDSFYDGGEYLEPKKAIEKAYKMAQEGADIIDIGGASTRPNSELVNPDVELERIMPVVKELVKNLPKNILISVDTYNSDTASKVLDEGVDIINDISGFSFDEKMLEVIVSKRPIYILCHTKGKPTEWKNVKYDNVVDELLSYFDYKLKLLEEKLLDISNIIIDPNIGFGKDPLHNIEVLSNIEKFKIFNRPIMLGVSRKSFIGHIIKEFLGKNELPSPKERLFGSLGAISYPIIKNSCHIVRAHDIKETREFLSVVDSIRNFKRLSLDE